MVETLGDKERCIASIRQGAEESPNMQIWPDSEELTPEALIKEIQQGTETGLDYLGLFLEDEADTKSNGERVRRIAHLSDREAMQAIADDIRPMPDHSVPSGTPGYTVGGLIACLEKGDEIGRECLASRRAAELVLENGSQ